MNNILAVYSVFVSCVAISYIMSHVGIYLNNITVIIVSLICIWVFTSASVVTNSIHNRHI